MAADAGKATMRWGIFGMAFSIFLMLAKLGVYLVTGSLAVLSDALESVVHIVTSGFALYAVWFAQKPRDNDHPYGHGRIEYLAEAVEGIAIGVAGMAILVVTFSRGPGGEDLSLSTLGLGLIAGIAVLTFLAGTAIQRAGVRWSSPTLRADGEHIRADSVTTIGAFIGVALVFFTGLAWIDMAVALLVGAWLCWTGIKLIARALESLMDRADPALLDAIAVVFARVREPGWVAPHLARAQRYGRTIHVDLHMVFPRFWSLERVHDAATVLERALEAEFGEESDLMLHMEACTPRSCSYCSLEECPVRAHPFVALETWTGAYIATPMRHVGVTDAGLPAEDVGERDAPTAG